MASTNSRRQKSLGEDSKGLGRRLEDAFALGTTPIVRSLRLKNKRELVGEANEPRAVKKKWFEPKEIAELALRHYNIKHGANLKFERALACNTFTCDGPLMDFNIKNTRWVHMNFKAIGPRSKRGILMFAELYLGDDGNYVLATLSAAEPSNAVDGGTWKKDPEIERVCPCCPDAIIHPWRGYRYGFNDPPNPIAPDELAQRKKSA